MDYRELCPVWIIDARNVEDDFCEKMCRQLYAYSSNEFGGTFDHKNHRWWKVERLPDAKSVIIDEKGHPSDIPAYSMPAGNYNMSALTVVVVGEMECFGKALDIAQSLREKKKDDLFMKGSGNLLRLYGLLLFNKNDQLNGDLRKILLGAASSKSKKANPTDPLPFDTLFLEGDCNRVEGNGQDYSYDHLEPNEKIDLAVQIVHHLALTQGVLSSPNRSQVCVAGAFSLNFEAGKERNRIAEELAKVITVKFTNNEGDHWHKESETLLSDEFQQSQGVSHIYTMLKSGFENLDTTQLVPPPPISPWKLLSRYLLPRYYRKYIRGLVHQVYDNTTAFSYLAMNNYGNHVDNMFQKITQDHGVEGNIEAELLKVWDKDSGEEQAIGMKQFMSRLKKVKDFFEGQQKEVARLLKEKPSSGKKTAFPQLADLPLDNFGEYHKKYAGYVRKEGVAITEEGDTRGEGKLRRLTRLLSFHPVALSLLVRSVLMAVLLPTVALTLLRLIPNELVNTEWFETWPGSAVLCVACFVLCVGWAVFNYHFFVVYNIKQKIKDYVAWGLYRTQVEAYRLTLKKAEDYFEKAQSICNDIEVRSQKFIDEEVGKIEDDKNGFEDTKFQTDIQGVIEGKKLIDKDIIVSKVKMSVMEGSVETTKEGIVFANEEQKDYLHYGVLRRALMFKNDRLLSVLKRVLFAEEKNKSVFLNEMKISIEEDVQFFLDNQQVINLTDIILIPNAITGFTDEQRGSHIGTIIRERCFPSAETSSDYRIASLVIPNRKDMAREDMQQWRQLLQVEGAVDDNRYDTFKGSFGMSIMRCYPLTSISQVTDIKTS